MSSESGPRQLVERVDQLLDSPSTSEAIDELTDALSKLAVKLRDGTSGSDGKGPLLMQIIESVRSELEDTNLPISLVKALHQYEVDPERGTTLEQVGRVAANLGADNGEQHTLTVSPFMCRH